MALTGGQRDRPPRPPKAVSVALAPGTPARYHLPALSSDASYRHTVRHCVEGLRSVWPARRALVVYVAADTPPLRVVALVVAAAQVHRAHADCLMVFREPTATNLWVPTLVTQAGRLRPYAPAPHSPRFVPAARLPGFSGPEGRRYLPLMTGSPLGPGLVDDHVPWDCLHVETTIRVRALLSATSSVGLVLGGPVRAVLAAAIAPPPSASARVALATLGRWTVPVLECDALPPTG